MLSEMLSERNLPPLKSREEMLEILMREEYGVLPDIEYTVKTGEPVLLEKRLNGGKCTLSVFDMTIKTRSGEHSFPVHALLQQSDEPQPTVIFMDFADRVPSFYYPAELIAENGFNVISFCYKQVTSDDDDFTDGLAGILLPPGERKGDCPGKIRLWAFAAQRLLDYALGLSCVDKNNTAVLGHSRLGKTALVAGALDERFKFVFSNNAGCAGDSLARGGTGQTGEKGINGGRGETIDDITRVFPYWFCPNYKKYAADNYSNEFDQHYLLAACAPRFVHIASAELDDWADQLSQKLCCLAAGRMWEDKFDLPGFLCSDTVPYPGDEALEGHVAFHCRSGKHFLSYHDWIYYIDYIKQNIV